MILVKYEHSLDFKGFLLSLKKKVLKNTEFIIQFFSF